MVCECTHRVRTYECDSNGHVNNAHYLNYLEYARHEYLRTIGFDYAAVIKQGYGVYIARIEIDYKKSAFLDDPLLIQTWPIKKRAASGILIQRILRGEDVIAEAQITWAFVNANGTPTKIPAEWDSPGLDPASNEALA